MGLSNYPPGVTGNEIQIAGPSWEGEITRTCTAEDVEVEILGTDALALLAENRAGRTTTMVVDFVRSAYSAYLPECPFIDGEVYAWAYDGVLSWTCPVCGGEYEEEGGRDD